VNNAVSCYKEAVQFSASSVTLLFVVFDEICGIAMNFVFFSSAKLKLTGQVQVLSGIN